MDIWDLGTRNLIFLVLDRIALAHYPEYNTGGKLVPYSEGILWSSGTFPTTNITSHLDVAFGLARLNSYYCSKSPFPPPNGYMFIYLNITYFWVKQVNKKKIRYQLLGRPLSQYLSRKVKSVLLPAPITNQSPPLPHNENLQSLLLYHEKLKQNNSNNWWGSGIQNVKLLWYLPFHCMWFNLTASWRGFRHL